MNTMSQPWHGVALGIMLFIHSFGIAYAMYRSFGGEPIEGSTLDSVGARFFYFLSSLVVYAAAFYVLAVAWRA